MRTSVCQDVQKLLPFPAGLLERETVLPSLLSLAAFCSRLCTQVLNDGWVVNLVLRQ